MINFYVTKIYNKEINSNTGEAWKVEDVPNLWKSKVDKKIKMMFGKETDDDD